MVFIKTLKYLLLTIVTILTLVNLGYWTWIIVTMFLFALGITTESFVYLQSDSMAYAAFGSFGSLIMVIALFLMFNAFKLYTNGIKQ